MLPAAPVSIDPIIKAGLAHLWFLTTHPFGDEMAESREPLMTWR